MIGFTRESYDKRSLPKLYFKKDYVVEGKVLYTEGEDYPPYNYNYDRMIRYLKNGVISQNKLN